jgi:hypothetical protein
MLIIRNIMMSYKNLLVLAMLLVIGQMKVTASLAQSKNISDGQFTPGTVYKETDLAHLVGKKLPRPSYLVGKFMYLGVLHNEHRFSTYRLVQSQSSGGYAGNNPRFESSFRSGFAARSLF